MPLSLQQMLPQDDKTQTAYSRKLLFYMHWLEPDDLILHLEEEADLPQTLKVRGGLTLRL